MRDFRDSAAQQIQLFRIHPSTNIELVKAFSDSGLGEADVAIDEDGRVLVPCS